jgi:hypothetical protein
METDAATRKLSGQPLTSERCGVNVRFGGAFDAISGDPRQGALAINREILVLTVRRIDPSYEKRLGLTAGRSGCNQVAMNGMWKRRERILASVP